MKKLHLIVGNKKYSSWSFRPWLLLKVAGIPFAETKVWIRKPGSAREIAKYSPAGRVPVLMDGRTAVWESLAICEHVAEKFPSKKLWPSDPRAKALARSVSHEMHAGFQALRSGLPCHFLARYGNFKIGSDARTDIGRVLAIWRGCRGRWGRGGPFLFGRFGVADAMYAPVVFRFLAYGVKVDPVSRAYMDAVTALPAAREWVRDAALETETIPAYENVGRTAKSK